MTEIVWLNNINAINNVIDNKQCINFNNQYFY